MDYNLDWIKKGNTGCNFATLFAKNPEAIGWSRYNVGELPDNFEYGNHIVSIIFPRTFDKELVRAWALKNRFFEEETSKNTTGLRYKTQRGYTSWVQYFGPDSHVTTRRTLFPELILCVNLPMYWYAKVGFAGILHLAHASVRKLSSIKADILWNTSFKTTAKRLGFKPTIKEAAKTTFYEER